MRNNQGQTLLEVVIAIALLVLVLTVMVSASVASMANNRLAKERAIATRLAQSAQDWLRGQRDILGWSDFDSKVGGNGQYCLIDLVVPIAAIYPCTNTFIQSNTTYTRDIVISYSTATSFEYKINVKWFSGKSSEEIVYVSGKLTKWE